MKTDSVCMDQDNECSVKLAKDFKILLLMKRTTVEKIWDLMETTKFKYFDFRSESYCTEDTDPTDIKR